LFLVWEKLSLVREGGKMFERAVKRVIKGALWRAQTYIQRLDEPDEDHKYDQDDYVYPWLNSIFVKLLTEAPGVLRLDYTWGFLHGVHLAKELGINRVSVIEFGVAGGNGLVSLDRAAEKIERILGVGIDVYGFDTGVGLPKPKDYRDLPNIFRESSFQMDVEALKKRLTRAQLVIGLVEDTVPKFIESKPPPVAFVSFDLDYYSSTMQAFKLLEAEEALLLPRVHCYFDDILGLTYSDYTGERLAISEFNASHPMRKISPIYGLRHFLPKAHAQSWWSEMFYMAHIFDHKLYGRPDGLVRQMHRYSLSLKDNESGASETAKSRT
jgi:hypothetical protein